jgi:transcriptional regulator with XRE-family HTH domain
MATEFGKALGEIRARYGETMADMARGLDVGEHYLREVADGLRAVPHDWPDRLATLYWLTKNERHAMAVAAGAPGEDAARLEYGRAPSPPRTEFGRLLRRIRLAHGETAGDAAGRLGCTKSHVAALENGLYDVPRRMADRMADAYGLDGKDREDLARAAMMSRGDVRIGLRGLPAAKREMAVGLAMGIGRLDMAAVMAISDILACGGETGGIPGDNH